MSRYFIAPSDTIEGSYEIYEVIPAWDDASLTEHIITFDTKELAEEVMQVLEEQNHKRDIYEY